jgi:hypothetical protein
MLIASSSLMDNASPSQALAPMTSSIDSSSPTLGSDSAVASDSATSVVGTVPGSNAAQSVPEPGTFVLILVAVSGIGLLQLRRRIRG